MAKYELFYIVLAEGMPVMKTCLVGHLEISLLKKSHPDFNNLWQNTVYHWTESSVIFLEERLVSGELRFHAEVSITN